MSGRSTKPGRSLAWNCMISTTPLPRPPPGKVRPGRCLSRDADGCGWGLQGSDADFMAVQRVEDAGRVPGDGVVDGSEAARERALGTLASGRLRGGHRRCPGRVGVPTPPDRETADDRRDDGLAGADREDSRRRPAARNDRLCRPAPDGAGGRRADRCRLWREKCRSAGATQRVPGSSLGDPRRHR